MDTWSALWVLLAWCFSTRASWIDAVLSTYTETERSSEWQPWYSLETLKLVFNVSSEYQSCHPDDLSVSVYICVSSCLWVDTKGFVPSLPEWCMIFFFWPLHWLHNERDGVSNHQPHDRLRNRLFRCRSKKKTKLRVTGLGAGNWTGTGEFPGQRASNAENVSIWLRHFELVGGCAFWAQIPHKF